MTPEAGIEGGATEEAYLIQILLPVRDAEGTPFSRAELERVSHELTEAFGGATSFLRSPAKGLWEKHGDRQHDDVVVIETMATRLDRAWWRNYRAELERRFSQESIIIRSQRICML